MSKEELKLLIDAIALGVAILGGIAALFQWRRDQSWKQAEKLDSMYKEFEANRLIQIACRVLDWSRGNFKFPDGEEFRFTETDVEKSFMVHGDEELTFTPVQVRMRDSYDAILAFFERLESAIDSGLVNSNSAMNLFGYWIRHFDMMPEHPECADRAMKYIGRYASLVNFNSLCGRISR
jgi:hypothetical protein